MFMTGKNCFWRKNFADRGRGNGVAWPSLGNVFLTRKFEVPLMQILSFP